MNDEQRITRYEVLDSQAAAMDAASVRAVSVACLSRQRMGHKRHIHLDR